MDLTAKTQNKRGGTPQHKENLGYVNTFIDSDNYILVDNYEGFGDTYKRSEKKRHNLRTSYNFKLFH